MEKGLIAVDQWREANQAYFLTHLHADHTSGLSSQWNKGPLFCSPISAALFPAKYPHFDLSLLRVLHIGSPHPLSIISPTSGRKLSLQVTAIDAHHCPGAVMYLFRGEFGCKLYTGDFRWETSSDRAQVGRSMLLNALGDDEVDILYIDNTFGNPMYSFPPREMAAQQVVDVIACHPDHDIVIGIDMLGKEDLLLHISHALSTKICVWPERLQIMHLLNLKDAFTTRTCLTRIRATPRHTVTIENLKALNTIRPTIGVMPSGFASGMKPSLETDAFLGAAPSARHRSKAVGNVSDKDSASSKSYGGYIYHVPYSDHSCFHEIHEFVKLIKPWNITGIVSSSSCYINPGHFFGYLCGAHQQSKKSFKKPKLSRLPDNTLTQTEYVNSDENTSDKAWETNPKVAFLTMQRRKLSIVRREKRGTRITEIDATCKS